MLNFLQHRQQTFACGGSIVETLLDNCQLCQNPVGDRPIIESGYIVHEDEQVRWVLIPSKPSSVSMGRHLVLTTISHHVGSKEFELRRKLLILAYNLGFHELGENFRLLLNQGDKASSFTHFHVHLIAPGEGERLVSAVANIPAVLGESAGNGSITVAAASMIKERILQKAR